MEKIKRSDITVFVILLIFMHFAVGIAIGIFMGRSLFCRHLFAGRQNGKRSHYRYTNPLVRYEGVNRPDNDLALVKYKLQAYQKKRIDTGDAVQLSIYIDDLTNGPWVGIDADAGFAPASLLKIPIMTAYFRMAQDDPAILQKRIRYDDARAAGLVPEVASKEQIKFGESYSVEDLIRRMIVYSDNAAKNILLLHVEEKYLHNTFSNMHLFIPNVRKADDYMSLEDIAAIFRNLYNVDYLNPEMSEKALALLVSSEFQDGLVAGVPSNVPVAHKFGEREETSGIKMLR